MYLLYSLVVEMCCNAVPVCGESESENWSVKILFKWRVWFNGTLV